MDARLSIGIDRIDDFPTMVAKIVIANLFKNDYNIEELGNIFNTINRVLVESKEVLDKYGFTNPNFLINPNTSEIYHLDGNDLEFTTKYFIDENSKWSDKIKNFKLEFPNDTYKPLYSKSYMIDEEI